MNAIEAKPKVLLHSCCGPCSTSVVERLLERYDITVFFYNPNLSGRDEYEKRRAAQKQFLWRYNAELEETGAGNRIEYLEGLYDPESFNTAIQGLEEEPEGGKRCVKCFELRLLETARRAAEMEFPLFGTTLSVSPHKNHALLCQIGESAAARVTTGSTVAECVDGFAAAGYTDLTFLTDDFKKKDGFARSIELAKAYGLYRQNYCGCRFSKRTE